MDNRFDNIEEAVNDIREKVQTIAIETAKNTINLELHMRRTEASEKRHDAAEQANVLLRDIIEQNKKEYDKKYAKHEKIIDGFKFLSYCIGVAAATVMFFYKLGLLNF